MKTVIKSFAIAIAATAAMSTQVLAETAEKQVQFVGDLEYAGFCKAIVNDDVRLIRTSIERNVGRVGATQRQVLRVVTSNEGPTCNGAKLIDFSQQRNASEVYEFLTK